jgi:hypothetical protein
MQILCLAPVLSKFQVVSGKLLPSSLTPLNRRLSRLEGQYLVKSNAYALRLSDNIAFQVMQSQMIGMQSSLDRILSTVQSQAYGTQHQGYSGGMTSGSSRDGSGFMSRNGYDAHGHVGGQSSQPRSQTRSFPPLPGFAPPVGPLVRSIYKHT